MRSRTRGAARQREGGAGAAARGAGAPSASIAAVHPCIGARLPGQRPPSPARPPPFRTGTGREGKVPGAGRERRAGEGTRRERGGCRELPRHGQPGTAYPHPAQPGRPSSFLPRFPSEVGRTTGAPFLCRRRCPSRPLFPLLSRFPAAPAGIPRSRIPGPSWREGTGGQRPAGPGARPRYPPPSLSPHGLFFFPLTPSRKSLNPESWGGAGAALAGAEGAGAGRAMPRSRGGPAGKARPAI